MHRASARVAAIDFSSAGDNTIISAPASGPICIYGILFTVHAATNITLKRGTTAISGPIEFTGAGSSMTLELKEEPWYWTNPGEDFILNSSSAVQVSGTVWYTVG
jgi:hypothetical protein